MDGCEAGDSESLQRDSSRVTRLTLMKWRGTPVLCKVHCQKTGVSMFECCSGNDVYFPSFSAGVSSWGIHNLPPKCKRSSRLQLSSSLLISQPRHRNSRPTAFRSKVFLTHQPELHRPNTSFCQLFTAHAPPSYATMARLNEPPMSTDAIETCRCFCLHSCQPQLCATMP